MKIQCDVCEKAAAVVICCADEAALCDKCDVEIHAAQKLASKHQRLNLDCLSNKLPTCDICQEKTAFIFCVEDRALFCRDCDEAIHVAGSLSGNHQLYLVTGIRVALSSICNKDSDKGYHEPPNQNFALLNTKIPPTQESPSTFMPPSWAVDEFLQLSDYESGDKILNNKSARISSSQIARRLYYKENNKKKNSAEEQWKAQVLKQTMKQQRDNEGVAQKVQWETRDNHPLKEAPRHHADERHGFMGQEAQKWAKQPTRGPQTSGLIKIRGQHVKKIPHMWPVGPNNEHGRSNQKEWSGTPVTTANGSSDGINRSGAKHR